MKTFTKNYKSLRVWLWFVSKITKNNYRPRLLAEFIETQKRYPNFLNKISNLTLTLSRRRPLSYRNQYFRLERVKTICHIKPKQTFLVNLTLWEIIPCETSHICRWLKDNWKTNFVDPKKLKLCFLYFFVLKNDAF